jgi:Undecaprenyl-phosphate galactose phosphotransferase WbaP
MILSSQYQNGSPFQDIPVLPAEEMLKNRDLAKIFGIRTAILIMDEIPKELATQIIRTHHAGFRSFIVVQNNGGINHLGVTPFYIDSILGLKVNDNLSSRLAQLQSRLIDFLGSFFGLVLLSPFFVLLSVLIRIDSPGMAIYRQKRIGKGGKQFNMLKFRTMYRDADANLTKYLEKDDSLKQEWDQFQKLREDPRVTRLGKFLRRYSIDELPQLWNVLKGEMSLVGPRPFLPEQLEIYNRFADYVRVTPGITGLWQVFGRNETDFHERAQFDEYYVHNWSIWLDIHILARTFWVVLTKTGAF